MFLTDIASRFVFSTCSHSDLTRTMLNKTLQNVVAEAFVAKWKKDDDPDDFGRKMYGSDNVHPV